MGCWTTVIFCLLIEIRTEAVQQALAEWNRSEANNAKENGQDRPDDSIIIRTNRRRRAGSTSALVAAAAAKGGKNLGDDVLTKFHRK